ncbi:MAG: archease [Candidatus Tectimicrobiota bacterium]
MAHRPFEIIGTTADVGVVASGSTCEEAFIHAAEGLFSLITDLEAIEPTEPISVECEGISLEGLLVAWLNELIYLHDVHEMLFRRFEIAAFDGRKMEATAWGEPIDKKRHSLGTEVKAATYHLARVEEGPAGWEAHVIVDV